MIVMCLLDDPINVMVLSCLFFNICIIITQLFAPLLHAVANLKFNSELSNSLIRMAISRVLSNARLVYEQVPSANF